MFELILLATVSGLLAGTQAQSPVIRSDVYVVHCSLTFSKESWRGGRKPVADFTADEFTIVVDRKTSVRAEVNEDEAKPGYYLVSFSPPDALRDGLTHLVDIKVRNWRFKFKSTFLKRPEGGFLDPSASG